MFFNSKMHVVSRQVLLGWKQLPVRHRVTTGLGQNWKFFGQNISVKQNCSLVRYISMSPPLHVKQVPNETLCVDDGATSAEILANLSPEDEKRLKVLKLEYDVFASTGIRVPDYVSDKDWVFLLQQCPTPNSRENYYKYLFKREKAIESQRRLRAANQLAREEKMKRLEQMKLDGTYEFMNTIRMRTLESTMNQTYNNNLCYALMNGPHLVFDFSFEDEMSERELTNLVRQVQLCHGVNKVDREPFHFHFCNLLPDSITAKKLQLAMLLNLPYTMTDQHYLQCYDPSRIVYLSPNAASYMTTFNHDDVYVLGSIVDKSGQKPLTFARAKKEKIRCVRFPFEQHVRWVQGTKSLTLNQCVGILLTLKKTNDWEKALTTHLPSRKFRTD